MRCHFMSDLHLEAQDFPWRMPRGELLVVAGDLCNACAFEAKPADLYMERQRDRVRRFADEAARRFSRVVMVAGNHEHYGGLFEETVPLLRRHLPEFTILDDEAIEIGGITLFGGTLWSDFLGRSEASMSTARRGIGDYFFVKTRAGSVIGEVERPVKLKPEDTLAAHERSLDALRRAAMASGDRPFVVVTHHAPSLSGLNPRFRGNGLDGAYASDMDAFVGALPNCPLWIHGHTHIQRRYRVGRTIVNVNCRGVDKHVSLARGFKPDRWVEIS